MQSEAQNDQRYQVGDVNGYLSCEATQNGFSNDTMVPVSLSKILEDEKLCSDKNDKDLRRCVAMGTDRADT